jgi:hypothetical protein
MVQGVDAPTAGRGVRRGVPGRSGVRRTAQWSLSLLSRLAADTGALYGTVTVEETMPAVFVLDVGWVFCCLSFVAHALTDAVPDLLPALRAATTRHGRSNENSAQLRVPGDGGTRVTRRGGAERQHKAATPQGVAALFRVEVLVTDSHAT